MAYDDELKAIALAETEEERLRLSGELAANIEAPEATDDVKALTEERDSLKADLDAAEKKYNDLRERYVDAFFSTAAKGRDEDAAPKQPAKGPERREGATLASLFGKE